MRVEILTLKRMACAEAYNCSNVRIADTSSVPEGSSRGRIVECLSIGKADHNIVVLSLWNECFDHQAQAA